ncbi:hypothetical protein LZ30DRAFT_719166 [Colletotrichum cereale]|nr:hypothetical protein LZ30DRAFT_719166 [Colletotrichum cereale]
MKGSVQPSPFPIRDGSVVILVDRRWRRWIDAIQGELRRCEKKGAPATPPSSESHP